MANPNDDACTSPACAACDAGQGYEDCAPFDTSLVPLLARACMGDVVAVARARRLENGALLHVVVVLDHYTRARSAEVDKGPRKL